MNTKSMLLDRQPESEWFQVTSPDKQEEYSTDVRTGEYDYVIIDGNLVAKTEVAHYAGNIAVQSKKREQTARNHIETSIGLAKLPAIWVNEKDVDPPNSVAKQKANRIAVHISEKHGLLPMRVGASIENGLMLTYVVGSPQYVIKIEVYNDSDVAGVISLNKEIIDAIDIEDNKDVDRLLDKVVLEENQSPTTFTDQWSTL